MGALWKGEATRLLKASRASFDLDRGHPLSPVRRALESLLPGKKYVLAASHDPSIVYHLNASGPKRFTVTTLPGGRRLVTRIA